MSMPIKADSVKDAARVIKAKPEHMANVTLASGYGVSVFLEHQYLVLMTVVYLFVTVVGVGNEVRELHDCRHTGRHER
jgi:hypothetical protein